MKKVLVWGAGAVFCLLAVGCSKGGDTPEGAMKSTIGMMNEMVDILTSIKDEASAKAATPKLQALGAKANEMKKQMEGMKDKVKPEEMEALKKKYEPQMNEAVGKLMKEAMRVAAIPGGADVMKALRPGS